MELRDYLAVIKRRSHVVVVAVVVAAVIASVVAALMPPKYTASATLHVATPASLTTAAVLGTTDYMDRLQNTYAQLATSTELRNRIARKLDLSSRPDVSVKLHPNTELMEVVASATKPGTAAKIANLDASLLMAKVSGLGESMLADADRQFRRQMSGLQQQIADERTQYNKLLTRKTQSPALQAKIAGLKTDISVKVAAAAQQESAYETTRASILDRSNVLSVAAPAIAPASASGPSVLLATVLGIFGGLVVGIGLAFLFENLSTRMDATDEIERAAGLPVLGAIPLATAPEGPLFNSGSPTEEAFRRLRTNILALERGGSSNVLLVTSGEPNEGKSTIVANLAASLAQTGQRVVAVDADLRLPTLHEIFDIPNRGGLTSVLRGLQKLDDVLVEVPDHDLSVLTSGGPARHPAELLASPAMGTTLENLRNRFDVVLVDSPALLALADALSLATEVPDVLIVVGRTQTRREALRSVQKQLAAIGAKPLGVIVNRAEELPSYHYYTRNRYLQARH